MTGGKDGGGEENLAELGPLPAGHHGLTREQIAASQRERLLAAIAEEVAEVGYRNVKIRSFTRRAGVSTRDFYDHFQGKEECFLAAFEAVRGHLEQLAIEAAAEAEGWPQQVISVLRAGLVFFAGEPDLARLCLIEPMSATPATAIRFREVVLACVGFVARGRDQLPPGEELPPNTEDSLLGGIVALVSGKILAGGSDRLIEVLPDLVEFTLSPYLGADRAAELAAAAQAG